MTDIELIREQSHLNLQRLLAKLAKFRVKRNQSEVDIAIKSLPVYHCTPDSNIIEVIKTQTLKVKNQVVMGEHTNLSTDFFQGFENHLSCSIGTPWVEYGQYCFAFGYEHIHPDSLAFCGDPWLWKTDKFQHNVLVRDDFLIYARALLERNLRRITGSIYVQVPWDIDLHALGEANFRKWEIKQAANLSILDAEEFFIWSNTDAFILMIVRLFSHPLIVALFGTAWGLAIYGRLTG